MGMLTPVPLPFPCMVRLYEAVTVGVEIIELDSVERVERVERVVMMTGGMASVVGAEEAEDT